MKQSPQMLARSIDLSKADAARTVDASVQWPSVGLNSRYALNAVSASSGNVSTSSGFLYNLGLSQPVFRWGDVKATVEIADLRRKIAENNFAETYRDLAGLLRTRFMQLIVKKYAVQCRKLVLATAEHTHAANLERSKAGAISPGDLYVSDLNVEESRMNLQREEYEYGQLKRVFCRLSGLKELPDEKIPEKLAEPQKVEKQAETLALYFDQSDRARNTPPALRSQYEIRQSDLRYKMARNRLLPKFDLSASVQQENVTSIGAAGASQTVTNQQSIGLSANWSLFDGFATRGAKRLALADRRDAELRLSNYLQDLGDQTRGLVTQFNLALKAMDIAGRRLGMASGSFGYAETESKAGRVSPSDLERLRIGVMEAEISVMNARAEVYSRWSDLVALLWLDPALSNLPPSYLKHGK